ncbi:cytochrome P450 3A56 [Pleuronectes platessa]|uniref:cytochrome P450 3A56 n=1 Tax=Pleuronectes platessa TaxID=8262 RepID=UPI00232A5417|nr:cytochrome P450 3A56 [Pleuronectes platessa]
MLSEFSVNRNHHNLDELDRVMGFLPFFSLETWILLITSICLFVLYGYSSYGVFEKMGIPGPKPRLFMGTVGRYNKVPYLDDVECAKKYGRVWGMYEFKRPMLAVMDPDMLKTILVKECFTYFINRRIFPSIGELYDTLFFSMGDDWRRIRNTLSPTFSSGRLKEMFSIVRHHSRKMADRLRLKVDNDEVIELKSVFAPYSLDAIASCAFSVDVDSINNPSSPIFIHSSKLFRLSILLFICHGFFPFLVPLLELFGLSIFNKTSSSYLRAAVEKIRAERDGQDSRDILQQMIDSQTVSESRREKQNKGLNDHEISSQGILFLNAGLETSNSALSFLAYNLAQNPEAMKHLQKEIDETFPNKGQVQYEALMQMEYLECVINESLRLYPPGARLEREAKETIKINGIIIPKGMLVTIPVYALHRDPELWPEPEEFKPDRFSKENKQNINPYAFLPFGLGPRNCVGMRFAKIIVKLALVEILQNYSFSVCEETEIPLQMDPQGLLGPLKPIKLKLVPRSDSYEHVDMCN